jgi:hypothetical protein
MKNISIKTFLILLSAAVLLIAVLWREIPLVNERAENVSLGKQWLDLLREHPDFSAQQTGYPIEVEYHYADKTDENLTRLRDLYDLDSIAGNGSEIEQIINLMEWVYRLAGHANNPEFPSELNAFTLIQMAQVEGKSINCYMKTVILNEIYLSMGFYSRQTHLLPHSNEDQESHFITSVYSFSLGKWILMDPDFGVYVTDDKGVILGVREIRKKLIAGEPLKAKRPGRSSLENARIDFDNFVEGADYPWFLSDFIFKMRCPKNCAFNQRSQPIREYFELIPDGYKDELLQNYTLADRGKKIFYINDESLFWQKPGEAANEGS